MLGGFLWATGNTLSVPVIKMIGLSLGLLIWGSANMIMGWLTGQLGILGVDSQADSVVTPWMNYVGFVLALISLACRLLKRRAPTQLNRNARLRIRSWKDARKNNRTFSQLVDPSPNILGRG